MAVFGGADWHDGLFQVLRLQSVRRRDSEPRRCRRLSLSDLGFGASSPLPDVTGLYTNFEGGFQKVYWNEISDFRSPILYEVRQGATWSGGQALRTQAHPPFIAQGNGTFWICAKVSPITGLTVYSETPESIVISGNQLSLNLVEFFDEQADNWPGTFDPNIFATGVAGSEYLRIGGAGNILTAANVLTIVDVLNYGDVVANSVQRYYAPASHVVDVGYVAQASVNASAVFAGVPSGQNILAAPDVLSMLDFLGAASTAYVDGWVEIVIASNDNDCFAPADVFAAADCFEGPLSWGPPQQFVPGVQSGRAFKLQVALETIDPTTIAYCEAFNYAIQVPARIDHYQNQSVPANGLAIDFAPDSGSDVGAFNGGPAANDLPYVSVSWQAQPGDTWQLNALALTGLVIQFWNAGVAVTRTGVNITVEGF